MTGPSKATVLVERNRSNAPFDAIRTLPSMECGNDVREQFNFGNGYRNLNHGSFGTYPKPIREVLRYYQDRSEARPDVFIRYEYPQRLDESREAIAKYLNVPTETCVFVANATTGINTVLRGLEFEQGDVIIYFDTIYGACGKTVVYITETTHATSRKVSYTYPISDADLIAAFEKTVQEIKASGQKPRIAIFDSIVSLPGLRVPFERLTAICRENGILSCIDGAHGVGHIPLDLAELDPDFFVSNCHKWLHVPRGCAVFYVPLRNQHFIRSTLPTSHGFRPKPVAGVEPPKNPLPPSSKSPYVKEFEFIGALDNSPQLCVPAALEWRKKLTWNGKAGEEAIMAYTKALAKEAGEVTSRVLGTEVMENVEGTLSDCNFSNVRLPLSFAEDAAGDPDVAVKIAHWIAKTLVDEYDTFIVAIFYADAWWVRLSSQVYLTKEDFEWGAKVLQEVCERVKKGQWKD